MLKTQSDASAVAANLPKICSGNCLHRGRKKVWIFEYANLICRHEHVTGVSHSANAGCIQTRWAQGWASREAWREGEEDEEDEEDESCQGLLCSCLGAG